MNNSTMFRRLAWYPVQHACSHFEARLMATPATSGAGSPCSECAPQGRPVQTHYDTPAAVNAACARFNERDGR